MSELNQVLGEVNENPTLVERKAQQSDKRSLGRQTSLSQLSEDRGRGNPDEEIKVKSSQLKRAHPVPKWINEITLKYEEDIEKQCVRNISY
jgi:hypothetical protein